MGIKDWDSTPIVNIAWSTGGKVTSDELKKLTDDMLQMHRKLRPPVESLKKLLGRQSYTWVGEYRFWVWETDSYRVFASNKQGVSFEHRVGLSKKDAFASWNDFLKRIGVTK